MLLFSYAVQDHCICLSRQIRVGVDTPVLYDKDLLMSVALNFSDNKTLSKRKKCLNEEITCNSLV